MFPSPHRPTAAIGDENARLRSRLKTLSFPDPLSQEAERLRAEADKLPPGETRDLLLRKARQADTATHVDDWLNSPGLQPPK